MRLTSQTDRHRKVIDNIVQSKAFVHSETSARLLQYLAEYRFQHSEPPKEYTIAVELLHRGPEFDPQIDSVVRVQIGRLRKRLHEYYKGEGRTDRIRVEIPSGDHSVVFRRNERRGDVNVSFPSSRYWTDRRNFAIVILAAACVSLAARVAIFDEDGDHRIDPYVAAFWSELLHDENGPVVVFSNARFVGNTGTGLRYFDAERDSEDDIVDHYTGVGEAYAVRYLSKLFDQLGRDFRLQRAELLSWEEAKLSDLVLIGSSWENPAVGRLRSLRSFNFRIGGGITNERPQPGEPGKFLATKDLDYAWLHLGRGLVPGRRMLILAGGTTLGTQAAVESVTRPDFIQVLYSQLGITPRQPTPSFEAVIEVNLSSGVPIRSSLVALHRAEDPPAEQ